MQKIVSVEWLHQNINNPAIILLDASISARVDGSTSQLSTQTIEGARYFDLKNIFSDQNSPFPNTIPEVENFEEACQNLGITTNSQIIVFDNFGIYTSPRVWWLFQIMGHANIAVLDGGLPYWIEKGLPTVEKYSLAPTKGNFTASYQQNLLITFDDIEQNVESSDFLVVDARSKGRFDGVEAEPRKHLQSGHIPNSVNIPYQDVLQQDGRFKSKAELKDLFNTVILHEKELVFSCGSGLTACIIMLASEIAFKESKKIYDGSWTEWAELRKLYV